ncbi:Ribosome-recycling factor [Trichinella spiralis]|uniref:Ribosome-recycling factor n=1 Tax=Trichinella spiralis TaxID=6334 RepID=A0ABR3KX51_TRISP
MENFQFVNFIKCCEVNFTSDLFVHFSSALLAPMLRTTWRNLVGQAIRNFSFSKNATLSLWMRKSYPLVESERAFSRNKGESKRRIVKLDSGELEKYLDEHAVVSEMENEVEKLREQYVQQLSLKNNIRAFEALSVEFDGKEPVPLNHIAQL